MSLIVPSFSGVNLLANSSTSSSTAAITSAANPAATALPFGQTLVQSMLGDTVKGSVLPQLGNLASLLQGLLNTGQTTGEETGRAETGKELLDRLAQDVEKLDESINSDPALLAALQGWLMQVSALLAGSTPKGESDLSQNLTGASEVLSPLARHSETIRFAVQDELNSLVNLIRETAADGNEETAVKGASLLNHFTSILAELPASEDKGKAKESNSINTTVLPSQATYKTDNSVSVTESVDRVSILANSIHKEEKGTMPGSLPHEIRQQLGSDSSQVDVESGPKLVLTPLAGTRESNETKGGTAPAYASVTGAVTPEAPESEAASLPLAKASANSGTAENTGERSAELEVTPAEHDVVTAGQLSMRAGITHPLKSETTSVPVHQFAKEMGTFITGKLEIIKKGGVAEATITLFPENLGQVDVKITMHNGNLVAQFLTEHSGAKDMLEQQMNQLRSALQAQGLQVEKLEVAQNSALLSQFNGQQGRQTASGGQQQGGRSKERREEIADAVLAADLNGEWKEWVVNSQQDGRNEGGSFSAKV